MRNFECELGRVNLQRYDQCEGHRREDSAHRLSESHMESRRGQVNWKLSGDVGITPCVSVSSCFILFPFIFRDFIHIFWITALWCVLNPQLGLIFCSLNLVHKAELFINHSEGHFVVFLGGVSFVLLRKAVLPEDRSVRYCRCRKGFKLD